MYDTIIDWEVILKNQLKAVFSSLDLLSMAVPKFINIFMHLYIYIYMCVSVRVYMCVCVCEDTGCCEGDLLAEREREREREWERKNNVLSARLFDTYIYIYIYIYIYKEDRMENPTDMLRYGNSFSRMSL